MVSARLRVWKLEQSARVRAALLAWTCVLAAAALRAGSLTPPGPPAPTMKTMDQVEPRTPITTVPVTIHTPGSYYFTKNLEGGHINVAADGVTIDLCGFTYSGIGVDRGIMAGGNSSLTVRNGRLENFDDTAIFGGASTTGTLLENLMVSRCGGKGICLGPRGVVVNCIAEDNGGSGITVGAGSVVMGCTCNSNGDADSGAGIEAGQECRIVNCTTSHNCKSGVWTDASGSIQGCTSSRNGQDGFQLDGGYSIIQGCAASYNEADGFVLDDGDHISQCVSLGDWRGIWTGYGCTVSECTVRSSTVNGILSAEHNLIERCTVTDCSSITLIIAAAIQAGSHTVVRQCEVANNWRIGIACTDDCYISLNNVTGNGRLGNGAGIDVSGSGNRIEDNNVCSNPGGIDCGEGSSSFVLRNTMQGNTNNYTQGSGNIWGTIVTNQTDMNNAANANINIAIP